MIGFYKDTEGAEIEMDVYKIENSTIINTVHGEICVDNGYLVYLKDQFPIHFSTEAFEQSFLKLR